MLYLLEGLESTATSLIWLPCTHANRDWNVKFIIYYLLFIIYLLFIYSIHLLLIYLLFIYSIHLLLIYLLFIYSINLLLIYLLFIYSIHLLLYLNIISNLSQSIPTYCGLFTHSPTHLSTPSLEANTQTVERAQSRCHILCLLLPLISCHVICRPAYICSWYTITVLVLYCLKAHKAENLQL